MNDDFYIGWEGKAAPRIGKFVRVVIVMLFMVAIGLALAFAAVQRSISVSVFEWGTVKTFSGILQLEPYPHLLVPRPGAAAAQGNFSTYYLVAPFKFGLDREKLSALDGKSVSTDGSIGLTAMAAVAGLASAPELARPFVQELWDAPIPSGQWRYYNGLLYALGLLEAGGQFKIILPPSGK